MAIWDLHLGNKQLLCFYYIKVYCPSTIFLYRKFNTKRETSIGYLFVIKASCVVVSLAKLRVNQAVPYVINMCKKHMPQDIRFCGKSGPSLFSRLVFIQFIFPIGKIRNEVFSFWKLLKLSLTKECFPSQFLFYCLDKYHSDKVLAPSPLNISELSLIKECLYKKIDVMHFHQLSRDYQSVGFLVAG